MKENGSANIDLSGMGQAIPKYMWDEMTRKERREVIEVMMKVIREMGGLVGPLVRGIRKEMGEEQALDELLTRIPRAPPGTAKR